MSRLPSFLTTVALAFAAIAPRAVAGEAPDRDTLLRTAEAHEAVIELDEAARDRESFARTGLDDARSPEALRRALTLRILLGEDAEAAVDAADIQRAWARKYPSFVADAELALARSRADRGAWDEAIASLGDATRALAPGDSVETQVEVQALLGRSFAALGRTREAITAHRRALTLATSKKASGAPGALMWSQPARDALAESRYFFAEQARARAESIKLAPYRGVRDRKGIFKYLTDEVVPWTLRRTAANEEAMRAYQRVLGVDVPEPPPPARRWSSAGGDPNAPTAMWSRDDSLGVETSEPPSIRWAIAAADRVGSIWADHVYTMRTLPVPTTWQGSSGVSEEYRMQLDSADAPYSESARRAFTYCLDLSRRHRIFDEHTRSCEAWFSKYRRSELVAFDEIFPSPRWAAAAMIPAPVRP